MLFSEPILTKFQLVSASPNWYSNVGHTNRLDYQDSPIQWHPNPMYSRVIEDMDPRSLDYGLTEVSSAQPTMIINNAASVQQRSISRFANYLDILVIWLVEFQARGNKDFWVKMNKKDVKRYLLKCNNGNDRTFSSKFYCF